jgi:hypothetical protein
MKKDWNLVCQISQQGMFGVGESRREQKVSPHKHDVLQLLKDSTCRHTVSVALQEATLLMLPDGLHAWFSDYGVRRRARMRNAHHVWRECSHDLTAGVGLQDRTGTPMRIAVRHIRCTRCALLLRTSAPTRDDHNPGFRRGTGPLLLNRSVCSGGSIDRRHCCRSHRPGSRCYVLCSVLPD